MPPSRREAPNLRRTPRFHGSMWEDEDALSPAECRELLDRLFPEGPAGADVRAELRAEDEDRAALAERIGLALWDIFSDNNDVLAPDGRRAHMGSFRASAGEIAHWINDSLGARRFGYMDFYMGTIGFRRNKVEGEHRLIFRRLKNAGCDWRYVFSALCLIDLGRDSDPYDPAGAFAREKEGEEMRRRIDEINRKTIEKLRAAPPPILRAYGSVFGRMPEGWPPEA